MVWRRTTGYFSHLTGRGGEGVSDTQQSVLLTLVADAVLIAAGSLSCLLKPHGGGLSSGFECWR